MSDPTWFASSDTATVRVVASVDPRLTPVGQGCLNPTYVTQAPMTIDNLRTVAMPDLRIGRDCRTADDKLRAELVRLVDALQALTLRVEMLEGAIAAGRAGVTA